jgi:hypothetical protein
MSRWSTLMAICLPLLGGCAGEQRIEPLVVIAGPRAFTSFELRDAEETVLWRLVADPAAPVAELVYGVVPDGFRREIPTRGRPRDLLFGEQLTLESITPLRRFRHEGFVDTHQRLSVDRWAVVLHDPPEPAELDAALLPP